MAERLFRRLQRALHKVLRVRRHTVYACDALAELTALTPRAAVDIIPMTRDNVGATAGFRHARHVADMRTMLARGQTGMLARAGGHAVGHAWAIVCRDRPGRVNGYFPLQPGEAVIHYCHVAEDWRGRGIYPALLYALCARLFREHMVRRIYIDSATGNTASCRGIAKTGFACRGTTTWVQLAGHVVVERTSSTSGT